MYISKVHQAISLNDNRSVKCKKYLFFLRPFDDIAIGWACHDLQSYVFLLKFGVFRSPHSTMPSSLMSAPVTRVIVTILTTITALVRLSLYVHVHPVVVHRHSAHESFATVFAVEPLVRVGHVDSLHVVFHILHDNSTDLASGSIVHLPLVELQVSVFEHFPTVGTGHHHSLMSNLFVIVQLVRVVRPESTGVTDVFLRMFGHVFFQVLLGLTAERQNGQIIAQIFWDPPDQTIFDFTR